MAATLYLFMGYPGAGKTTVARTITEATGGIHLWADFERHVMFENTTHSEAESKLLYDHLNRVTEELLGQGKCVIFDTNFNYRADRDRLREIAQTQGADTVVVWVQTPVELAKQRAVQDDNLRNGYEVPMTAEHFDALICKLEPPTDDEAPVIIDGEHDDEATVKHKLGL